MTLKRGQSAFTLTEMLVVMAILAITFGLGLQAAKMIMASFESGANVRHTISAALANARALAMKEGTYVGVRFQPNREGRQYMILIRYDYEATGLANGFVAVDNRQPTPLPKNVLVLDPHIVSHVVSPTGQVQIVEDEVRTDGMIQSAEQLNDTLTFSLVFDKSGRLTTHEVRVRNRNGLADTSGNIDNRSPDDIFNKKDVVDAGQARFYQDDYFSPAYGQYAMDLGYGPEFSRHCFIVVQRSTFEAIDSTKRWTAFVQYEPVRYVNPFSGEIVNQEVRP
jgi:prepilin-type N-terminal cleavage/methylation domain-containing protein